MAHVPPLSAVRRDGRPPGAPRGSRPARPGSAGQPQQGLTWPAVQTQPAQLQRAQAFDIPAGEAEEHPLNPSPTAPEVGHAHALEPDRRARPGPGRDAHGSGPQHGRHPHAPTQRGPHRADVDPAGEVLPAPVEARVHLHANPQVEVTGGRPGCGHVPHPREPDARAGVDPGRDAHPQDLHLLPQPTAGTGVTGARQPAAASAAQARLALPAPQAHRDPEAATARTDAAAGPPAEPAGDAADDRHAPGRAVEGVLEGDAEVLDEVTTGRRARWPGWRRSAVVSPASLGIGEDLVGLADLLEALRRPGIARVVVGMVSLGQGPKGPLHLGLAGGAVDAQDLVVVPLRPHRSAPLLRSRPASVIPRRPSTRSGSPTLPAGSVQVDGLAQLLEEALGDLLGLAGEAPHLAQEVPLLRSEIPRDHHLDLHELGAPPPGAHIGHALPGQPEGLPVLRAGGDGDLHRPVQRGHLDPVAQSGLDHVDAEVVDHVLVLAPKLGMRLDLEDDVEVAGWAAAQAGLALAGQPDLGAGVDPGRDADAQPAATLHSSLPVAGAARGAQDTAGARARRAGRDVDHRAEDRLGLPAHLSPAAARAARLPARAGLGTGAAARLAGDEPWHLDLLLRPPVGLLEADGQVVAQVVAPCRAGGGPAAEAAALEPAEPGRPLAHTRLAHAGVPEHVVGTPLLRVGEDRIGLVDLLETLGGGGITRVAVRMVLHGQPAEGPFEVVLAGVPPDAQDLVVVALDRQRLFGVRGRPGDPHQGGPQNSIVHAVAGA